MPKIGRAPPGRFQATNFWMVSMPWSARSLRITQREDGERTSTALTDRVGRPRLLSCRQCRMSARSEERRVGKECRCRWSPDDEKKKPPAQVDQVVKPHVHCMNVA